MENPKISLIPAISLFIATALFFIVSIFLMQELTAGTPCQTAIEHHIHGWVIDGVNDEPLPDVNIRISSTNPQTCVGQFARLKPLELSTDYDGYFEAQVWVSPDLEVKICATIRLYSESCHYRQAVFLSEPFQFRLFPESYFPTSDRSESTQVYPGPTSSR